MIMKNRGILQDSIIRWSLSGASVIIFLGIILFFAIYKTGVSLENKHLIEGDGIPSIFYLTSQNTEKSTCYQEAIRWIDICNPKRLFEVDNETEGFRKFIDNKQLIYPIVSLPQSEVGPFVLLDKTFEYGYFSKVFEYKTSVIVNIITQSLKKINTEQNENIKATWATPEGKVIDFIEVPDVEKSLKILQNKNMIMNPVCIKVEVLKRFVRCSLDYSFDYNQENGTNTYRNGSCGNKDLDQLAIKQIYSFLEKNIGFSQDANVMKEFFYSKGLLKSEQDDSFILLFDFRNYLENMDDRK